MSRRRSIDEFRTPTRPKGAATHGGAEGSGETHPACTRRTPGMSAMVADQYVLASPISVNSKSTPSATKARARTSVTRSLLIPVRFPLPNWVQPGNVSGFDRWLKVNTVKQRTHALFRQGHMLYDMFRTGERNDCARCSRSSPKCSWSTEFTKRSSQLPENLRGSITPCLRLPAQSGEPVRAVRLLADHLRAGRLEVERGRDEGARVGLARIAEDPGRGAAFHHRAVAHHQHLVAHRPDHP